MQPVFNHYKAVSHMCAYISKAEDETSEAIKQAAKEALIRNKSDYEKMKSIARAFATRRECSVQEAVYLVMPEPWLCIVFPQVIFLNSNLPEKQCKLFEKKGDIKDLTDDSAALFQINILDRYLDCPNESLKNGMYSMYKMIDRLCFAEFLSLFYRK